MSLEYNKKLIPRAKELRRNMTRQEKHLWYDYLIAAIEADGIPFDVKRRIDSDLTIREAIARRKADSQFYTIEDCIADIDEAIAEEVSHAEV